MLYPYENSDKPPIIIVICGAPEVEIKHQELGVCGDEVLCSGSLWMFRLMFGWLLSSLHPPSLPSFPSAFSLFCLHSLSARDMNTSRSNSRSLCLTGSDSKDSSFCDWDIAEVEERASGWRKRGEVGGETGRGEWVGNGEVGDEGIIEGRQLEEDVTGGSGLSLCSSYSADGCCTMSV